MIHNDIVRGIHLSFIGRLGEGAKKFHDGFKHQIPFSRLVVR